MTEKMAPDYSYTDKIVRTITTPAGGKVVVSGPRKSRPAAASPGTPEADAADLEREIAHALTDSGRYFEADGVDVVTVSAAARIAARAVEAALAARDGEVRQLREVVATVNDLLREVLPDDNSRIIGDTVLSTIARAVDELEGTAP